MNKPKKIDENKWKRKEVSDYFARLDEPCFTIVSPLNVTKLATYTEINGISFYYALIYLSIKTMESVEEFHYKLREDGLYYYDELVPLFTDYEDDNDLFITGTELKKDESMIDFCKRVKKMADSHKDFYTNKTGCDKDQLVFVSCLPLIAITSIDEAHGFDKNDSIPHIFWGKIISTNGQKTLNYEVQANHRLVDGYQISKFLNELQINIDKL